MSFFVASIVDCRDMVVQMLTLFSPLSQRPALPNGPSTSTAPTPPLTKKPRFGKSMITDRLFRPSTEGKHSHLNLPSSCAIYSILNWMAAHPTVEGIQVRCVETLPFLLEDEQQRLVAQRVGLVEVVVRAMMSFRESLALNTAGFHALVLLARPLGGKEGMLFDKSMSESSATLGLPGRAGAAHNPNPNGTVASAHNRSSAAPKVNGIKSIQVMLESMERFKDEPKLQAMACWAMVNLALVPAQKNILISLGSFQATTNAMRQHPQNYDVQFRALFALINLVPCKNPAILNPPRQDCQAFTERDALDEAVHDIVKLSVLAMKNFYSCEAILNRACLVIHNISQIADYQSILLWTPHLYQILEWAIANHPTDQVLVRSASSTLFRLQSLLASDATLQRRFQASLAAHKLSLNDQGEKEGSGGTKF